jgi:hypothetical protein
LIFLEMLLVLGLVLGFAVWELRSLRRGDERRPGKRRDEGGGDPPAVA